jgi:hypothetical protein
MTKIYLKKVDEIDFCNGCYFFCDSFCGAFGWDYIKCPLEDNKIFKKISERTAKKLLKSGWRRTDAML